MTLNKFFQFGKNKLYKLNRSITGQDTKKTLSLIKVYLPSLKIKSIKSGEKIFDWKIPPEWNVKKAFVLDKNGEKIIDFKDNNLHLIGYSTKIKKKINKTQLLKKLHTLPSLPNAIPYKTSYYKKEWGFCVSEIQKKKIKKKYKKKDYFLVNVDTSFNKNGKLNYGELYLKGKSDIELIISTYICHPSMANNELSGPIVSMALADYFKKKNLNYSLRFIFIPETIGSIAYIYKNLKYLRNKRVFGINLTCIGDNRGHSFMFSKFKNTPIDESVLSAYKQLRIVPTEHTFLKRGSDERQFNSPGIDIPMASIFRTKYGEFSEYHTSLDDFKLVTLKGLRGGYKVSKKVIEIFQKKNIPKYKILCEPHLSKRKLYPTLSGNKIHVPSRRYLDFLQYADGYTSLDKISKNIQLSLKKVKSIYIELKNKNMVY